MLVRRLRPFYEAQISSADPEPSPQETTAPEPEPEPLSSKEEVLRLLAQEEDKK